MPRAAPAPCKIDVEVNFIDFDFDLSEFSTKLSDVVAASPVGRRSGLPTQCPACAGRLAVTQLCCSRCRTQIEGEFALPELLRLDRDDLQFVLEFVRHSGSLKEMGKLLGQSYPTVRNRLNDIIARLSRAGDDIEQQRRATLDALADGKITVGEATARLEELDR